MIIEIDLISLRRRLGRGSRSRGLRAERRPIERLPGREWRRTAVPANCTADAADRCTVTLFQRRSPAVTGDFLFGFACGVGTYVLLAILGSLLLGRGRHPAGSGSEPCSDL
jgi:hypothetical protein